MPESALSGSRSVTASATGALWTRFRWSQRHMRGISSPIPALLRLAPAGSGAGVPPVIGSHRGRIARARGGSDGASVEAEPVSEH